MQQLTKAIQTLSRKVITQDYLVTDGKIRSPGKFQGEPSWAPWFYHLFLTGDGHVTGNGMVEIAVIEADRRAWPDLTNVACVTLFECSQGFVYARKGGALQ